MTCPAPGCGILGAIMSRRVALLVAWLAATVTLGAFGYGAVALVGSQVTDRPTAEIVDVTTTTLEATSTTDVESDEPVAAGSGDEFSPETTLVGATTSSTTTSTTSTTSTGSSSSNSSGGASSDTTVTSSSTTSSSTSTTTTTTTTPDDDDDSDGSEKVTGPFSFGSPGGVVTVSCQGDDVSFGGATPSSGASVQVKNRGPSKVVVEFTKGENEWTTEVTCDNGKASAEYD